MINRCCISISEKCNMSCNYCHFSYEGKRQKDMTDSDLIQIIQNIGEYVHKRNVDIFKIGLVGGGEPLFHFDTLKKLVDCARFYGNIKFYTISNGYSISMEQLEYFYANRDIIALNFSLDGYKEIHDLNRHDCLGNGTYDRVMDSIDKYEQIFSEKPHLNCTITSKHIENSQKVLDFFINNDFEFVTFTQIFDAPRFSVTHEEFEKFLDMASEYLTLRQKQLTNKFDCSKYGKFCGVGITNPYFSGGKVYPCGRFSGQDTYCLGSATEPLEEIEEKMRKLNHDSRKGCYYDLQHERGVLR